MTTPDIVRVGTRGSQLARVQTQWVLARLAEEAPGLRTEVIVIRTAGDEDPTRRPARFSGTGIFTGAIEDALERGTIDIAVHSLKDLPTTWPEGLCLGAVPVREDARDALVGCTLSELSADRGCGVRIGTSSLRRRAQLLRAFPGCEVLPLRGNIDTRLRKVAESQVDAAVLAAAGLRRLGRGDSIACLFGAGTMLPAPGQGALGIQVRTGDTRVRHLVSCIHCSDTAACVTAERAFMRALEGGCHVPVGAAASIEHGRVVLRGRVLSLDGADCLAGEIAGAVDESEQIGARLAQQLLERGGAAILEAVRQQTEDSHA